MGDKVVLFFFVFTFFLGCQTTKPNHYLYPSANQMEVKYLCNLPYFDATSSNQKWSKSKPSWLILNKKKAIVFFENNQTFLLKKDIDIKLSPGKYRCIH